MRLEVVKFIYIFMVFCTVNGLYSPPACDGFTFIEKLKIVEQSYYDSTRTADTNDLLNIVFYSGSLYDDADVSLDLDNLIAIAIDNNLMIEVGRQQKIQSKSQLGQARSEYLPQLSLSSRYYYTEQKNSAFDNSGATGQDATSISNEETAATSTSDLEKDDILHSSVNISQLLYDFGKTSGAVNVGKANLRAASAQLQYRTGQIIFQVKKAYYQVLEKKRLIDVARETVTSFKEHLRQSEMYYKTGFRTQIDVISVEVELENAKLALLRAEYDLETAKVALTQILGSQPNNGRYSVSSDNVNLDNLLTTVPPVPHELDALIARAQETRSDLSGLRHLRDAAGANVDKITADYYPRVMAEASYNYYDTTIDSYKDGWEAGVILKWDLFSGMRTSHAETEAKSRLAEARVRLYDQELTIKQEVTNSFLKANEYFQSIQIALKTVQLAKKNAELAAKRYKSGAFSVIELNDAQLNLTKIQNDLVITYYGYLTALAGVEFAVGGPLGDFDYATRR